MWAGAQVLLGLDGLVVLGATEEEGELWLLVETPRRVVACATCGTKAKSKGRVTVVVRVMASGGRPVRPWPTPLAVPGS